MQALNVQLSAADAAPQEKPAARADRKPGGAFAQILESLRAERNAGGILPEAVAEAAPVPVVPEEAPGGGVAGQLAPVAMGGRPLSGAQAGWLAGLEADGSAVKKEKFLVGGAEPSITIPFDVSPSGAEAPALFQMQPLPPQDQAVPQADGSGIVRAEVDALPVELPQPAVADVMPQAEGQAGPDVLREAARKPDGGVPDVPDAAPAAGVAERMPLAAQDADGRREAGASRMATRRSEHQAGRDDAAPVFTVADLRTQGPAEDAGAEGRGADERAAAHIPAASVRANPELGAEAGARQDILSSNDQSAGAAGSTFQQMLAQQVQQSAPDFVRAGSIVLRDNDRGAINLVMKPESLGNVKISLQVSDKVIAGQITVSSREAYEAFRQNLDTLRQAFQQGGFDAASFNLNLADSSGGNLFQQGQPQGDGQFLASRAYGDLPRSADAVPAADVTSTYTRGGDYQIDVVA